MFRRIILALASVIGLTAAAHAADLDLGSLKDPLPDGPLTWRGITLYGAIDVGVTYQTHGAPLSGALGAGLEYTLAVPSSNNLHVKNLWSIAPDGLSSSFVGLKMEEALGFGWSAVAKIETAFLPTSGELSDGCASLARDNGLSQYAQTTKGDSSRCGQALNGPVYVGMSNAAYGTLTLGRQNSLMLDANAAYDPQRMSFAFSLLGYSGGTDGTGDTESSRWDDSVKYVYQYGPFHAAAMYTDGGAGTSIFGGAYGFNAGVSWRGFSIDSVYDKAKGVVASTSLPVGSPFCTGGVCPTNLLGATISDNEAWGVMGKYSFELGGGYKDSGPTSRLTLYAGFENITYSDPSSAVPAGMTTIGGYILATTNNLAYRTDKTVEIYWTGASYETGPWRASLAYYGEHQNDWLTSSKLTSCASATAANKASHTFIGNTIGSNCSGNYDAASFVVDYTYNKHFDTYAGVQYSAVNGGFESGFLQNNTTSVMTGIRLKF
ncbi:MAG: porin [Rhodomicrobium sp.]